MYPLFCAPVRICVAAPERASALSADPSARVDIALTRGSEHPGRVAGRRVVVVVLALTACGKSQESGGASTSRESRPTVVTATLSPLSTPITSSEPTPVTSEEASEPTDLVAGRSVAAALEIDLMRTESTVFGGVEADESHGVVNVHYLASVDRKDAVETLRSHLAGLSIPGPTSDVRYPVLQVEVVASTKTYSDYNALMQLVASSDWTTDVATRVSSLEPDYSTETLRVGIVDLDQVDIDRARRSFGLDVVLFVGSPNT